MNRYFTLVLTALLFCIQPVKAQWMTSNPANSDFCTPTAVTYTYSPGDPNNTINWYVDDYGPFSWSGSPATMFAGTGTSFITNPFQYSAGIRVRVEEVDFNGMVVFTMAQNNVTHGNYSIPAFYDYNGCGTLKVAPPYDGSWQPDRWSMWYKDGIATGQSQGYLQGPLPGGSYVYKLLLACSQDTLYTDPIQVTGFPTPVITASGVTTFCNGDSVILTVSPTGFSVWNWSVNWATIPGSAGKQSITVKSGGEYRASVYSGGGSSNCSQTSAPVSVTVNPAAIITAPSVACGGDTVTLVCTPANSYVWSRNNIIIQGANAQTLKVTQGGNYKVTTTGLTCNTSKVHNLKYYAKPSAVSISTSGLVTLCKNEAMTLSVTGNNITSWNWLRNNVSMAGSNTSSITVTKPGNYKCIVSNAIGCSKTTQTAQITNPTGNDLPSKDVTIKIGPTGKDSYTTCAFGQFTNNFGNAPTLETSAWYKHFRTAERGYLKFSLSSVPAEAPVVSATLKLYADTSIVYQNGQQTLFVKRLIQNWQETGINWNDAPDSSSFQLSAFSVIPGLSNSTISIPVTEIVRHWSYNPADNLGLLLHLDENITGSVKVGWMSFYSGDHADATKRPKLVVKYSYADIIANGPLTFCAGGSVTFSSNPGYTYKWYKNNNLIAGATSVNYTATTAGNYHVVISNAAGCTVKSETKTVTVPCREGVAVDDDIIIIHEENNPEIKIILPSDQGIISVYDMSGRLVRSFTCDEKECEFLKTELTPGIYMIHVVSGDAVKSERFMIY